MKLARNGTDGEDLLLALSRVVDEVDPVPDLVRENAAAAFDACDLDVALVRLIRDSAESLDAVTVRAGEDLRPRLISFETDEASVEMRIEDHRGGRRLVAHVLGPELATASIETPHGSRALDVEDGLLVADAVPAGMVRLVMTTADGRTLATSWTLI